VATSDTALSSPDRMFSNTRGTESWSDQNSQNAPKKRGPKPKNEPAASVNSHSTMETDLDRDANNSIELRNEPIATERKCT
jgi:hypothetical protein